MESDFTLITLPECDESNASSSMASSNLYDQHRRNKPGSQNNQSYQNRVNKYKELREQGFDSEDNKAMGWRYQEANLKFIDNIMPDSLKICSNPYNMLKYISQKNQLTKKVMEAVS